MQLPPWIAEHKGASIAIVVATIVAVFYFTRGSKTAVQTATAASGPNGSDALAAAQLSASVQESNVQAQLGAVQDTNATRIALAPLANVVSLAGIGAQQSVDSLNINQTADVARANIAGTTSVSLADISAHVTADQIAAQAQEFNVATVAQTQQHIADQATAVQLADINAITNLNTLAITQNSQHTLDQNAVTALYQTELGRAPDAAGLAYWTGQLDTGASYVDVQHAFTIAAVQNGEIPAAVAA